MCRRAPGTQKRVCQWRGGIGEDGPLAWSKLCPQLGWVGAQFSECGEHGVPNSNLRVLYKLSFKCTKARSEEGQKYSLVFEGSAVPHWYLLSTQEHNLQSTHHRPSVGLCVSTCHLQPSCWGSPAFSQPCETQPK